MSALEIRTGPPPVNGRYVVWTPCAALQVREWCEPSIATWHNGRWHSYDPPWAWIGPLPVVHGNDCLKKFSDPPSPSGDFGATVMVQGDTIVNVEYDL